MSADETLPFQLDDHSKATQATHAIAGYIHQVYHSINSWIDLSDRDVLFLEVREDYAVWAKGVLAGVQVRRRNTTVSLGTKDAADLITSHWQSCKANPELTVKTILVTTSAVRHEQSSQFPGGVSGIEYWARCRADKLDISPIRAALARLSLANDLRNFLSSATDEKIRELFIDRIEWICDSNSTPSLVAIIEDKLVIHGSHRGVTSIDSEKALGSLLRTALETATLGTASERRLTRADFLRCFDKETTTTLPKSIIADLLTAKMTQAVIGATDHVDPRSLQDHSLFSRTQLVQRAAKATSVERALWLHGPVGCGKTDIAIKIAKSLKNEAIFIPRRSHLVTNIANRYAEIISRVRSGSATGIIIDSIDSSISGDDIIYLRSILHHVTRICGGWIMVTATNAPPEALRDVFPHPFEVPNLTYEDVANGIKKAGGDAEKWTLSVYRESWLGNPSLAHIRISGLVSRGWPADEINIPMSPGSEHWDIKRARQKARASAIANYSADAISLLGRLSVLSGVFDRRLANAIGGANSQHFDALRGPFIEQIGEEHFAISSLMRSAPEDWGISESEITAIRQLIIDDIVARKVITPYLIRILIHQSLIAQSAIGVMTAGMMIWQCSEDLFGHLAKELQADTQLSQYDSKDFISGNPSASIVLRLSQYKIASHNRVSNLNVIANRLLLESAREVTAGVKAMYVIAATTILFDRNLYIRPNQWMAMIRHLRVECAAMKVSPEFSDTMPSGSLGGADIAFMSRSHMIRGTKDLLDLIQYLDQMPAVERARALAPLSIDGVQGESVMMQAGWHKDCTEPDWEPKLALARYSTIRSIIEKWGNEALLSQSIIALATLLDEYLDNSSEAVEILLNRLTARGKDLAVYRHLARVYYRSKRDEDAVRIHQEVLPQLFPKNYSDIFFSVREGMVSSDRMARRDLHLWFLEFGLNAIAYKTGPTDDMKAGIFLEKALWHIKIGEIPQALKALFDSLQIMEHFSDSESLGERYRVKIFMNLVTDIHNRACLVPVGSSSNLDPHKMVSDLPPGTILGNWYMGAAVEQETGESVGFTQGVLDRTKERVLPSMEHPLFRLILGRAIVTSDHDGFIALAKRVNTAVRYMLKFRSEIEDLQMRGVAKEVSVIQFESDADDGNIGVFKDALMAFLLHARCRHESIDGLKGEAERALPTEGALRVSAMEMIACSRGVTPTSNNLWLSCAFVASRLNEYSYDPEELQADHCALAQWMSQSMFSVLVQDDLWEAIKGTWVAIIERKRFSLRSPAGAEESVRDIDRTKHSGQYKVIALCLAMEQHSGKVLSTELRENLRKRLG